jgi:hypothetical protein
VVSHEIIIQEAYSIPPTLLTRLFAVLGIHVGANLGNVGAMLRPSWDHLGPAWGPLWVIFGSSWPSWSHLEPARGLVDVAAILEPSLGPLGANLGPFGGDLGPKTVQEEVHAWPRQARHSSLLPKMPIYCILLSNIPQPTNKTGF